MWEFEIMNKSTEERTIIFGYSLSDAFKRNTQMNSNDWICIMQDYVD